MPALMPSKTNPSGRLKGQATRGQARFAFTILLIINILNYADRYVLSAVLPKIQSDLRLTSMEEGILGSSFLLVYAISTLPLGIWADRSVRKNVISLCVALWSVATTLAGLAHSFLQLFAVRSTLGIGEAGYAPASLSLLGDSFSKAHRGRVLSYWSVGPLIGAALGFTFGGMIADSALGWRWAFYIVGLPGLVCAFLAWRMAEPKRGAFDEEASETGIEEAPPTEGTLPTSAAGFRKALGKLREIRTYWILICALIFSFFTVGGTSFWLPTYAVQEFHLKLSVAGLLSGLILVVSGVVGTLLGGWLSDTVQKRFPQGRLLIATLSLLLGAPLVLIALFIHALTLFIIVFILAGITLNACTGPLNAVTQDVIPPRIRSTAIGLSLLLAHLLGDAAAPFVIGSLAGVTSLGHALLMTAPASLFIAGLFCLLGLRTVAGDMERMRKGQEQENTPDLA